MKAQTRLRLEKNRLVQKLKAFPTDLIPLHGDWRSRRRRGRAQSRLARARLLGLLKAKRSEAAHLDGDPMDDGYFVWYLNVEVMIRGSASASLFSFLKLNIVDRFLIQGSFPWLRNFFYSNMEELSSSSLFFFWWWPSKLSFDFLFRLKKN